MSFSLTVWAWNIPVLLFEQNSYQFAEFWPGSTGSSKELEKHPLHLTHSCFLAYHSRLESINDCICTTFMKHMEPDYG